ncbi:MAG: transglycosylase SLT domain-containing protein [Burkholderiales bacterium]
MKKLFALAAVCLLPACSQIPWSTEPEHPESAFGRAQTAQGSPFASDAEAIAPAPPPIPAPAPEPVLAATVTPAAVAKAAAVAPATPVQNAIEGARNSAETTLPKAAAADSPREIDVARPADDLWERIRAGFAIPDLEGPLVRQRERWYASQQDYLARMVERSKLYLFYIVEEIEKRGIPTEIALLPMVESAFNPMAYSRSHASGLWQFIPSTGRNYKLSQNWWADSRRDVIASTDAALDYLQMLYEMHGDWHLALASYNFGENGIGRAIRRNKARGLPTDYQSLKVPRETRGYVPKLQALKNIISNPEAFGITLEPIPNEPYFSTIPAEKDIDIVIAAKLAEMSADELIALNPALNRPVISGPHTQSLVLPADRVDTFRRNLETYDQPLTSWQPYTMKKGDSLDRLAARHGVAVSKLRLANGITSRTKVGPGSQLLLPIKGSDAAAEPLPAVFRQPTAPARRGGLLHIVRKGETLYGIARRYRVSTDSLRRWNHIGVLTTGQRLYIYRGAARPRKISTAPLPQDLAMTILPVAQR